MTDYLILFAVFLVIVILAFQALTFLGRRREIRRNIEGLSRHRTRNTFDPDLIFGEENEEIAHFFDVQKQNDPDSIEMRLIRAGFFSRDARRSFNLIRLLVVAGFFVLGWYTIKQLMPAAPSAAAPILAVLLAGVSFILCNLVLERIGLANQNSYRKLFPDFMDLLIVCVDAGLSIEAAIDRVSREFLKTKPSFGLHLAIVSLETRAGRPLHEALANLAVRVNLEEVRALAVLFRQSQELGASVIKTLRVYSKEMRQLRLIRAEEKANALPVKMLFPLALFLFPVNLVMVLVPILIRIMRMFSTMTPGG